MLRKKRTLQLTSGFLSVQRQAQGLLAGLRREIRNREAQLAQLRAQESGLRGFAGASGGGRPGVRRGGRRSGARVNWSAVLKRLPKEFSAGDVRAVRGIRYKRSSEIFAAITRWIQAGSVKRKARGVYERA